MYFHLTSALVSTTNRFSSNFYGGPTSTFIALLNTLIFHSLPTKSVVTHTMLSNNTFIDDGNLCTNIYSDFFFLSSSSSVWVQYTGRNLISVYELPVNHCGLLEEKFRQPACTAYATNAVLFSILAVFLEIKWGKRTKDSAFPSLFLIHSVQLSINIITSSFSSL